MCMLGIMHVKSFHQTNLIDNRYQLDSSRLPLNRQYKMENKIDSVHFVHIRLTMACIPNYFQDRYNCH